MHLRQWLPRILAVVCMVPLLMLWGCGGSSSTTSNSKAAGNISITGAISFPGGTGLAKTVAATTVPTVEVRGLDGTLVATATVTGTGPYTYTVTGLGSADYIIKVVSGSEVLKALLDQGSLSTATTRDVNTISTATLILAERKLGVTPGTIGETSNAQVTSSGIAGVNPVALETTVTASVNAVLFAPGSATQANVDIANLASVVGAAVFSGVDPSKFAAGTGTTPVTTTQYAFTTGTGASTLAPASVPSSAASTTLTAAATSYTPPAANSVTFAAKAYDYKSSATGVPVAGVTVTTIGLTPAISATTDANGLFVIAGIPQSTSFSVKLSKASYADSYSSILTLTANLDTTDRPYAMFLPSALTAFGNAAGNGVIRTRVVASTDQVNGFLGGAVVTATDQAGSATYPVKYTDDTGALSSTLTSTNPNNGLYTVVNVPAGHTVNVTAIKTGFTFNTKTFLIHADADSQGRIVGTATTVTTPPATNPVAAAFQAGTFEVDDDTINSVPYYFYKDISFTGSVMSNTASYFNKATGTWSTTAPAGVIISPNYALTTTGWVQEASDSPGGYGMVFNADGTATITSPTDGSQRSVTLTSTDLSSKSIASSYSKSNHWPLKNGGAALFPAGSVLFNVVLTPLTDIYELWNQLGTATSIASAPATIGNVSVDSVSSTNFYCTFDTTGNTATIHAQPSGSTISSTIGTATWATTTVHGQQILEISIPSALRVQNQLGGNPILSVLNGLVWEGSHSAPNVIDYSSGGLLLNKTALDFMVTQFNSSLAMPVANKALSKRFLGR